VKEIKNKKILVTGGAGFVGSYLVDRLSNDNEVTVLDDLSTGSMDNLKSCLNKINFIKGDILNEDLLWDIVPNDIQIVFHLAARISVKESFEQPELYLSVNSKGTELVLSSCVNKNIERFVYASTAAIYSNGKVLPLSPYGRSKLYGEWLCKSYSIPYVILRYFNIYGNGQRNNGYAGVIPNFIERAKNKQPYIINGDGEQTRDFIEVEDIVNANILAVTNKQAINKTFDIGTGNSVSVIELVNLLSEITSNKGLVYTEAREGDIEHSKADIAEAKKILNFNPCVTLKDGLKKLWES